MTELLLSWAPMLIFVGFGQPVIGKKADTLVEELSRNLRSVLVTGG